MEMMNKVNKYLLCSAVVLTAITGTAREKVGSTFRTATNSERVMAGCSAPQSSAELTVNNVRTIIFSGGDMWWDLFGGTNAWYYVPKVEDRSIGISSNFAGNVWFGGLDVGGQLKIAAQTYRQFGIDFWTGPLTTTDASTTLDVCNKYDKIFRMNRADVDNMVLSGGPITSDIKDWPGNGDISLNQDPLLAPFKDVNGDGIYTPEAGDYPWYDVYNNEGKDNTNVCKARVFGDQTLWWVYNDNGGVHQATGGKAIGMEVRAQAFAFKTTDEINNMTFYNYQIINRSKFSLTQTYMTVWTDADLGYYGDDYIGCDVKRGLGYIYNADNFDETVGGVNGYGSYIPALGCDFFQGPINTEDGIDNNGNGIVDEPGEQMGMTIFNYHNNNVVAGTPIQQQDPSNATQFYQYMTGFWRDGTPFTCGGNAYGGSIPTKYVYPADTYTNGPCGSAPWSELTAGNTPNDRRFMQSAGPFTLKPGATNYITFGLPWARTTSTDASASIPLLKIADDKAQALFNNCFKVLSGPEAPDMTIQEMSNELLIYFSNKPQSNNYLNQYAEKDVSIIVDTTHYKNDDTYRFEGFKVYQLKNQSVTQEELVDPSKAKLVFACDINNGIKRLINFEFDATTGGDIPRVKVEGSDNGLQSTFRFARDEFATSSDKKVVNNKEYYFIAVAYGYNQYGQYKEDTPWSTFGAPSSEGQKRPYLEGRKSKRAYGTPHIPDPEKDGTIANAAYGYGPKITRVEGQGNGGNKLDLTQETVDRILANGTGREINLTYENGRGPINVKVVDPLNVPNTNFAFMFVKKRAYKTAELAKENACEYSINEKLTANKTAYGQVTGDSTTWVLKDLSTQKEYHPCKSIRIGEEFYFSEIGMSLYVGQTGDVGNMSNPVVSSDKIVQKGDFIEGTMEFANSSDRWLSGVADQDGTNALNWIRSGSFVGSAAGGDPNQNDYEIAPTTTLVAGFLDPNQEFESILGGTWSPYILAAATKSTATGVGNTYAAPAYGGMITSNATTLLTYAKIRESCYDIRTLSSVSVVFTKDKSKWTRAMVVEECDERGANPSGAKKLELRRNRSVDKQGVPTGSPGCNEGEAVLDTFTYGCGWFPGYAINLETGERLNIAFGEDSKQDYNNGRDMMWNPTAEVISQSGYPYSFGGRHYVYIFGNARSTSVYGGLDAAVDGKLIGAGNYSNYTNMVNAYKYGSTTTNPKGDKVLNNIWSDAMWVTIPTLTDKRYGFSNPADMPCDVKVKLRVKKAYRPGYSGSIYTNANAQMNGLVEALTMPVTANSLNYTQLTTDMAPTPQNGNFGYYTFSTADIYSEINNADRAKNALDLINVVPNPYYAYSTYEKNRTENKIKITNLPNKCKIKIFTLNGTLVRTFDRDVSGQEDLQVTDIGSDFVHSKRISYQDWDLKNQSGIVIASGLYIIHVDVPGVGEKILKWFGVIRPLDLQNY
eukprot:TRINITY_DN27856_c0_g1_i1.p1 TRINITY_DN27856_c0_g1~~TRINITY_DN27856_c0_g1_i1.p1  ORF type:complete len:1457 (+),score=171.65 TRINITY_DN27856_c0_g1_i1:31-4371(+)